MSQEHTFDVDGDLDEVQPEPEPQYADPDDAFITRDGTGARVNQEAHVEGFGDVLVKPLNYGDVQGYFGTGAMHEVETEAMAPVFGNHYIEPDFTSHCDEWHRKQGRDPPGRVTGEYLEDMKPLMVRDLLMTLMDASGIEADVLMDGTTAQVNVQGN